MLDYVDSKSSRMKLINSIFLSSFLAIFLCGCTAIFLLPDSKPSYATIKKNKELCEAGNLESCFFLGRTYDGGYSTDIDKAKHYLNLACDAGHGEACYVHGYKYVGNLKWTTDVQKAATLFAKACDNDFAKGCNSLAYMYRGGYDFQRNVETAIKLYEKSCSIQYDIAAGNGCLSLGNMYKDGDGVEKNTAKASAILRAGCDRGSLYSCKGFGEIHQVGLHDTPDSIAVNLYTGFCANDDLVACNALGRMFQRGWLVDQDIDKALVNYRKSCDGGFPEGCFNRGYLLHERWYNFKQREGNNNPSLIFELFKKACDGGNAAGCGALAGAYKKGQGIAKDETRAMELRQQACEIDKRRCWLLRLE